MAWTDDRVEVLKKLWAEGLSASQIAARLGGVTRNAVIGKVHRLGLSGRATPSRTPRPKPRRTREPSHPSKISTFRTAGANALKVDTDIDIDPIIEPEPAPLREVDLPPTGKRCNILQLSDKTCRWPIGDPGAEDFCFCGANPKAGQPYCEHHVRLAYQPAQDRRRRQAAGARR
ncbi:MAG: GcrA cell cycle regulator [Alphaproteobacteria bacterium]|nr:GcrA cell cycle regulator [Alphaproteobacteria bacterium]